MKTIINIGLNVKNITGVEIEKDFKDIKHEDIAEIVRQKIGDTSGVVIYGWADVANSRTIISELKKGDRFMFNGKVYIVKQKFSEWSRNDDAYLKTECGEKFYHDGLDVEKLNDKI